MFGNNYRSPQFPDFGKIFQQSQIPVENMLRYPPRNIIAIDNTTLMFEFAVAGFTREDIKVTKTGNKISVIGTKQPPTVSYVHQGISNKSFEFSRELPEGAEIQDIKLRDGILSFVIKYVGSLNETQVFDIQ